MTRQIERSYSAKRLVQGVYVGVHYAAFAQPVEVYLGYLPEEETTWHMDEKSRYWYSSMERCSECAQRASNRNNYNFSGPIVYEQKTIVVDTRTEEI